MECVYLLRAHEYRYIQPYIETRQGILLHKNSQHSRRHDKELLVVDLLWFCVCSVRSLRVVCLLLANGLNLVKESGWSGWMDPFHVFGGYWIRMDCAVY